MPVKLPIEESATRTAVEPGKHSITKGSPSASMLLYTYPMHPEVQQDHAGDFARRNGSEFRLGDRQRLAAKDNKVVIYRRKR